MKHRISGRKLGRDSKERKALFRSLATSFVHHGFLKTSLTKAKAVQPVIERLAAKARGSQQKHFRSIHALFQDTAITQKLFHTIEAMPSRSSGFTRIERVGVQRGDAVPAVRLEWVKEQQHDKKK